MIFVTSECLIAQNYLKQVLILNEGYFDYTLNQSFEPVTIGSYDPVSQNYIIVDTILGARFASDLIIDGDYFYVAADNMLYKYNKSSYELIYSQQINGIRHIAIWNDKILVTRGDYDNTTFQPIFYSSYFQVFNKSDLSFYYELDTVNGPKWATQNLIVKANKVYVAINNAYDFGNEKGMIGVVDLNTFSYVNEINLGIDGINPDNMMQEGDNIYTINNKDWSGMSISKINTLTNYCQTFNLATVPTGCGTSCIRGDRIYYQIFGDTTLYEWDIQTLPILGDLMIDFNKNFYKLEYEEMSDMLYTSSTDFFSYGNIDIYDKDNVLVNSFQSGVSPGSFAFDVVNMTSINHIKETINKEDKTTYDLLGKIINNQVKSPGLYIRNNNKLFISE